MATPIAEKYYAAFKKFYPRLSNALPITDLLPYCFKGGIVPRYLKERLNSILVRSDKVTCLLDEIERGLLAGIIDQFDSFICVMEEFATENNDIVVKKLTEDIRSTINENQPICTVNQSSLAHPSSSDHEIPGMCMYMFIRTYVGTVGCIAQVTIIFATSVFSGNTEVDKQKQLPRVHQGV